MDLYTQTPEAEVLSESVESSKKVSKVHLSTLKVYLYFAIALVITGAVGMLYPIILVRATEDIVSVFSMGGLIAGIIGMIIGSIMVVVGTKGAKGVVGTIGLTLLSIGMGLLVSPIMFLCGYEGSYVDYTIVYIAFFITAGVFVICGLLSKLLKNVSRFVQVLSMLGIGLMILMVVNLFMMLFKAYNSWAYFGISVAIQALFMIYIIMYTILDFKRISEIGKNDGFKNANGLAIMCAANLYFDFIYIFLRILLILAALRRNN